MGRTEICSHDLFVSSLGLALDRLVDAGRRGCNDVPLVLRRPGDHFVVCALSLLSAGAATVISKFLAMAK